MKEFGLEPKWRWDQLIDKSNNHFDLEIDTSFTNIFFELIIKPKYTYDRYYHTLRHIEYMLYHVHNFKYTFKETHKLKWSIWFHDLIYDSKRTDNEKKSADALARFADAIGFLPEDIEEMRWMILVTSHKGSPQTKTEEIICDLDLLELSSERYEQNSKDIRMEYSHLSDKMWYKNRLKFLESMLNKDRIYHTDLYLETREATARHNIQTEINTINQKLK